MTLLLYVPACLSMLGWLTAEHFPPWVSWHNELWVFASALWLASAGLIASKIRGFSTLPIPGIAWIGLALMGVGLIQFTIGSIDFLGNLVVFGFYLALVLIGLIIGHHAATQFKQSPKTNGTFPFVEFFATVLMLGAICSAAIALAQVFEIAQSAQWITPMASSRRPGGNLGQPNQLATLLLMGMASLVYLFEQQRLKLPAAACVFFLLMFGVVVTESRTGFLGFVLMAGWWAVMSSRVGFRLAPGAVLAGCAAFVGLFWYWPQFFTFLHAGGLMTSEVAQVNTSVGSRIIIWPQMVEAGLQHPWFGWGLGGVSKAHNAVVHKYAVSEAFTYSHNLFLDLAVGIGFPLTILFMVFAATWLWRRVRATRTVLPWYCLAVLLPFCLHSMTEFPFAYAYLIFPAALALGALEGSLVPQKCVTVGWWQVAGIHSIVMFAMAWSVIEYVAVEEDFRVARFETLNIGQTKTNYEKPAFHLLTQLGAMLDATRLVPSPMMEPQQIALLRKVALHFPWPAAQNRYALTLALNDDREEAVRQLKVMRAMHGGATYEEIRTNWASLAESKFPQLKQFTLP